MLVNGQNSPMDKITNIGKIFAGFLLATVVYVLGGVRLIADLIGYSTAPEDAEALRRKLPGVLEAFFNLPWWVVALVLLAMVALASWLVVSGVKGLVANQKLTLEMPSGYMTAHQAKQILDWAWKFRDDYLKETAAAEISRAEMKILFKGVTEGMEKANSIAAESASFFDMLEQRFLQKTMDHAEVVRREKHEFQMFASNISTIPERAGAIVKNEIAPVERHLSFLQQEVEKLHGAIKKQENSSGVLISLLEQSVTKAIDDRNR